MVKKSYPLHIIDSAIISTIHMLERGKIVRNTEMVMYVTHGIAYIGTEPMPSLALAVLTWFDRYTAVNPMESGWGPFLRKYLGNASSRL